MSSVDVKVDQALADLGTYGRYQMMTFFICGIFMSSFAWGNLMIVFVGDTPPHYCTIPTNSSINESIPWDNKTNQYSTCKAYPVYYENSSATSDGLTSCTSGWQYEESYGSTIVTEWDLVCDKSYISALSQSVYTVGNMIGSVVLTNLADCFGRKPIFIVTLLGGSVIGFAVAFVQDYIAFILLRAVMGILNAGMLLSGCTLALELFCAKGRTMAGTVIQLFWVLGMMTYLMLAYFIRDWRRLQMVLSIPIIVALILIWCIRESIPWLVTNGKLKEANDILKRAAKFNNVKPTTIVLDENSPMTSPLEDRNNKGKIKSLTHHTEELSPMTSPGVQNDDNTNASGKRECMEAIKLKCGRQKVKNPVKRESLLDVFKSCRLLIWTLVMTYVWFTNSLVYWGLTLNTGILFPGNRFLNFFLSAVAELVAYTSCIFVLKVGRRWPLCIFHIVAGVFLLASTLIPSETADGSDLTTLIMIFGMIGKFGITGSFDTIYVFTPELYPTNVRTGAFGLCSFAARIGGTIAPFAMKVDKTIAWLPGVCFGVGSLVAAGVVLLCPETLNRPLPESIQDVEKWNKKTILTEDREL